MPEPDFELYLSLLSRFLRLKPAQRNEIADELRDHLEERLEELSAQGLPRAEAIKAALDEFGDAAELAHHFTHVVHVRRRRQIMRYTFGTVATLAASLLIAAAFWPAGPQAPSPRNAVAQAFGDESRKPSGTSVAVEDREKAGVEAKLDKRLGEIEFLDMALEEAVQQLSDRIEVDILLNRYDLTDEGVALDQPVTLKVKRANPTARAALDFLLEPVGLSYTIRDGLIMVTTNARANQILVYNVRDLVANDAFGGGAVPAVGMMGGWSSPQGGQGGGFFDASNAPGAVESPYPHGGNAPPGGAAAPGDQAAPSGPAMMGGGMGGRGMGRGMMGGGMGGGMGGMVPGMPMGGMGGGMGGAWRTNSLAQVIATTIDPDSWDSQGGNGSIVQYHDLLVVKNSQTVHGKIKALLEMMRVSARSEPGHVAPAAAPGTAPAAGAGLKK